MVTVEAWYKGLPPFTRTWFTCALVTGICSLIGIPLAYYTYLDMNRVIYHFEIWRLFTAYALFGKVSMGWLMAVFLVCNHVRELETTVYAGRRGAAEMVFVALYGMLFIAVLAFFEFGVNPTITLISMFVYLWSRILPHSPINVYGFTLERWHTPAVMVVLSIIFTSSPPFDPVWGVLIGHTWKMLTEIMPRVYDRTFVKCPDFLYDIVNKRWPRLLGEQADPAPTENARPAWQRGTGYRLG